MEKIKLLNMTQITYSQHFIFFVTCEWVHWAWMLHNTRLKMLVRGKHFSLLGLFLSNTLGSHSQHFIFFVIHEWAQWARVLHYSKLKRLVRAKHSSFLGPFIRKEENEALWIRSLALSRFIEKVYSPEIITNEIISPSK